MSIKSEKRAQVEEMIRADYKYRNIIQATGCCAATIAQIKADMGLLSHKAASMVGMIAAQQDQQKEATAEEVSRPPEIEIAPVVCTADKPAHAVWNSHTCADMPANVRIVLEGAGAKIVIGKTKVSTLTLCPWCGDKLANG